MTGEGWPAAVPILAPVSAGRVALHIPAVVVVVVPLVTGWRL
jgi:hypothetical protein